LKSTYLYLSNIQTACGWLLQYVVWIDFSLSAIVRKRFPTLAESPCKTVPSKFANKHWWVSNISWMLPSSCLYSSFFSLCKIPNLYHTIYVIYFFLIKQLTYIVDVSRGCRKLFTSPCSSATFTLSESTISFNTISRLSFWCAGDSCGLLSGDVLIDAWLPSVCILYI